MRAAIRFDSQPDGGAFGRHSADILDRLSHTQSAPPTWLVFATAAAALAVVCYRPVWRMARHVATIAHEGGHAIVALLVGRQLDNIKLHSDTSGVTVTRGKPYGLGMVLTMMAGYPAPPLLGVGFAALLGAHRITLMLWLAVALLATLLLKVRNVYGVVTVLVTGAAVFVVSWFGSTTTQAAFAYLGAWFLLFAGIRPVLELRRTRRYQSGSDADQLARLTGLPGAAWIFLFAAAALAALCFGGTLMIEPS